MPAKDLPLTSSDHAALTLAASGTPFHELLWGERLEVLHTYYRLRCQAVDLDDRARTPVTALAVYIAGITPNWRD